MMFEAKEDSKKLIFRITSDLLLIEKVVERTRRNIARNFLRSFDEFEVVLRELLNNAVVHGNRNNLSRVVTCRIDRMGDSVYRITVEDEGNGFNFKDVDKNPPENPKKIYHRGFILISAFSRKIRFDKKGSRVTAYVELKKNPLNRKRVRNAFSFHRNGAGL